LVERRTPKPRVEGSNPSGPAIILPLEQGAKTVEKVKSFIREVRAELNKITWPGKQQVWYSTLIVIFVTVLVAAYLGIVDLILTGVFAKIIG
jgi:preprotein translocase subunit SecE